MNKHDHHTPSDLDKVLAQASPHEADRLREMWMLAGSEEATDFPKPDAVTRIWQTLEAHAAADAARPAPSRDERAARRRRVAVRPWMAMAATLLIGAAIGVTALWMKPVVKTAALGERLAVMLPDGSQAELNSGASLRYDRRFGSERVVHLEGEAFFDVAKEERPFVVHTFNAQTTVLGTRFNVRAWSQSIDPNTTVALESGRVKLAPAAHPEQAVTLEPGQTHRIGRATRELSPPDSAVVARATAWRQGELVYKDQWLGVILEDVERRFAVDFTVRPGSLRQKRLTLDVRPRSAEALVRDVCLALEGVNYRETSSGFEIYGPAP